MNQALETLRVEQDENCVWWIVWPDYHAFSGPFTTKEQADDQLEMILKTCR